MLDHLRRRIAMGAYILAPEAQTEAHVRDLAACGIDFLAGTACPPELLVLLHSHGMGAMQTGVMPHWWGGDGKNAGQLHLANPLSAYEQAVAAWQDHPAVWGIDVGDEPAMQDFPHYGKVFAAVPELCRGKQAYLNIYPQYGWLANQPDDAVRRQLGTDSFCEYIDAYCRFVESPYVCFDHYMYSSSPEAALCDMRVVSDVCRRYHRDLWMVLQVSSSDEAYPLTENQLRFQAYAAMAFGAKALLWACWSPGWFHYHVLDKQGEKTQQYDRLQRVIRGVHALDEAFLARRYERTAAVGRGEALDTQLVRSLHGTGDLLAGVSRSDAGETILLLASGDPWDGKPGAETVTLCAPSCRVTLHTEQGVRRPDEIDGAYAFTLERNHAAVLTVEPEG